MTTIEHEQRPTRRPDRKVWVQVPLTEQERAVLRHRALDEGKTCRDLVRSMLGFPDKPEVSAS